jgi:transposase InsO family protein
MDYRRRDENRLHYTWQPWENGFIESFNARLRDELLDGEIFYSLNEAKIVIESWRRHYNAVRPHGSLTSARGFRARSGLEAVNELTFEVDPSVGAGQFGHGTYL